MDLHLAGCTLHEMPLMALTKMGNDRSFRRYASRLLNVRQNASPSMIHTFWRMSQDRTLNLGDGHLSFCVSRGRMWYDIKALAGLVLWNLATLVTSQNDNRFFFMVVTYFVALDFFLVITHTTRDPGSLLPPKNAP